MTEPCRDFLAFKTVDSHVEDALNPPNRPLSGESPKSLLTVDQLAVFLAVTPSYVYEMADELGAMRLPSKAKAKPRLRFDLDEVRKRLTSCQSGRESPGPQTSTVKPRSRSRARPALGTGVELLPVRGRAA
jgi:hypothetical protein